MRPQLPTAIGFTNETLQQRRLYQDWIWDGVILEGAVTLLSAPEKTGKSTLLSLLFDRRRAGGLLLGRAVRPGLTALCSEENDTLWIMRQQKLQFGPGLEFHRPFNPPPSMKDWRGFLDHLVNLGEGYFDLLVIDTAMSFLPAGRNNPRALLSALEELRFACIAAAIVLVDQKSAVRKRSRTAGALAAGADILMDMRMPPTPAIRHGPLSRRREFTGVGRYPGVLDHVVAELNADGTDYVVLPPGPAAATTGTLETIRTLLSASPTPLTRQEILARWPEAEPVPRPDSLWRTLTRGCEAGLLIRTGAGTRLDAFRYGLREHAPAA